MQPAYPTEEAAQRRVTQLKAHGIWPGIRQHTPRCPCIGCPQDGTWSLLYDPADIAGRAGGGEDD
jgi:hypothetical protein